MPRRPVLVVDTNVWMDLQVGRILEPALSLPARWTVPDLVLDRDAIPESRYEALLDAGVSIVELAPEQV